MIDTPKQIELAKVFIALAKREKLNEDTKKYKEAEYFYYRGIMAMLGDDNVPPVWIIYIITGRSICEETMNTMIAALDHSNA